MDATTKNKETGDGFSAEERAAMKARAAELKAEARRGRGAAKAAADAEDVQKAIAEMSQPDRGLAERIHTIVTDAAPTLAPKTWYGFPAYALDGKIICYFQPADKFKSRYATLGFNDVAKLDDGTMWATSFAVTELGAAEEATIAELVRKAVS